MTDIIKKLKINRSLGPVLFTFVISFLVLTISRIGLVIWQYNSISTKVSDSIGTGLTISKPNAFTGHLSEIFFYGLRYDVSILCSLLAIAFLLSILCSYLKHIPKPLILIQRLYLTFALCVVVLTEITTPSFIIEYGVRPNHIFIEYLIYPKEVVSMLANGHIFESIGALVVISLVAYFYFKFTSKLFDDYKSPNFIANSFLFFVTTLAVIIGIRGTVTEHRPLNPSTASFSTSPLANSLPYNSLFNIFYAYRHMSDTEISSSDIYSFDIKDNVLNNLKHFSKRDTPSVVDKKCAINQIITPSVIPDKKRNVVIILEESFGARYVKSLGGDDIAPNHDALREEGWAFDRLYAIGHRSVRGIEAVTASYPPGPLASQVKPPHIKTIATYASIYKALGYNTSFIYGGESHFDGMRTYFYNNGVDNVIEQKDYENPQFVASWGVSDEDLFKKANESFVKWSATGQPFCSLIFTSSFHDPFDIPQGKVDIKDVKTDDPRRLTAAKYADYALGEYFKMAKKEDYYKNTVFLIIADHDSRVRGLDSFPLTNFAIPAIIISPDIKPHHDRRVVSQMDMLPTLLSLTGVKGEVPLAGQDLTKDDIIERAPVAYNELFGYLKDGKFTLLAPGNNSQLYQANEKNRITLLKKNLDRNDIKKEISYLNLGITIYENEYNNLECAKNLHQEIKE